MDIRPKAEQFSVDNQNMGNIDHRKGHSHMDLSIVGNGRSRTIVVWASVILGVFSMAALILRVSTGFYQSYSALLLILGTAICCYCLVRARSQRSAALPAAILLGFWSLFVFTAWTFVPADALPGTFHNQPMNSEYLALLRSFDLSLTFAFVGWAGWRCGSREDSAAEQIYQNPGQDNLTGLCNRSAIDKFLVSKCLGVMERRSWLSVIIADIDHFRRFNAKHGHEEGDRLLVQVASILGAMVIRSDDLVGRYGGQAFAIILPDTNPQQASMLAQNMRLAVANAGIVLKNDKLNKTTITLGVASSHSADLVTPDEIIEIAEQQTLKAKKAGRNQVQAAVLQDNKPNVIPLLSSREPDSAPDDLIQGLVAPRLKRLGS